MNGFTFRPAKREQTPLIIGLAGPSKSGKTYSALRLATGMANGKPIAMINTEGARGHMYADKFQYQAVDIGEPFSYERYRDALLAAKELKPGVVIIDSISHAHEGPGGMLDQHETWLDQKCGTDYKKRERMTWTAWIKPKSEEAHFINTLIQQDFAIVLCFRAKEKLKIVRGQEPVPMGWQPICSDRIPFETTATLILTPGCKGAPDMTAQASELREPLDTLIQPHQINEELGQKLAAWAAGAKENATPRPAVPPSAENADSPAAGGAGVATLTKEQILEIESLLEMSEIPNGKSRLLLASKVTSIDQIRQADFQRALAWIQKASKK